MQTWRRTVSFQKYVIVNSTIIKYLLLLIFTVLRTYWYLLFIVWLKSVYIQLLVLILRLDGFKQVVNRLVTIETEKLTIIWLKCVKTVLKVAGNIELKVTPTVVGGRLHKFVMFNNRLLYWTATKLSVHVENYVLTKFFLLNNQ